MSTKAGACLVVFVAVMWVGSSMLTQAIFTDLHYDRPIFFTYLNMCGFSLYLVVYGAQRRTSPARPLRRTLLAACAICPTWFFSNVAYNISLATTSLASNTVLCNTSPLWTMILCRVVVGTPITLRSFIAVALCMGGAVFVVSGDDVAGGGTRDLTGDVFAIASAMLYAVYTVMLQQLLPSSHGGDGDDGVTLLFGLMGLLGAATLWPCVALVDRIGFEPFALPPANVIGFLVANNILGTVVPQLLWAKGVLMTTPLIATLGLSLTIPLSMIADGAVRHTHYSACYLTGCLLVAAGFLVANTDTDTTSSSKYTECDEAEPGELDYLLSEKLSTSSTSSLGEEGGMDRFEIPVKET